MGGAQSVKKDGVPAIEERLDAGLLSIRVNCPLVPLEEKRVLDFGDCPSLLEVQVAGEKENGLQSTCSQLLEGVQSIDLP